MPNWLKDLKSSAQFSYFYSFTIADEKKNLIIVISIHICDKREYDFCNC